MEPQTNKAAIVGVIVVIVIAIAAGVYYSWPKTQESISGSPATTNEQKAIDAAQQSILVKHSYANGEHIYTGSLQVPTPCHEVSAEAVVMESFPEQVRINLNIVPPAAEKICAQVVTGKTFTVRYKANETAVAENGQIMLDGGPVLFIVGGKD